MMVRCKARIKIKQRMPAKPIKIGLKLWTVCEAKTSYVNKTICMQERMKKLMMYMDYRGEFLLTPRLQEL